MSNFSGAAAPPSSGALSGVRRLLHQTYRDECTIKDVAPALAMLRWLQDGDLRHFSLLANTDSNNDDFGGGSGSGDYEHQGGGGGGGSAANNNLGATIAERQVAEYFSRRRNEKMETGGAGGGGGQRQPSKKGVAGSDNTLHLRYDAALTPHSLIGRKIACIFSVLAVVPLQSLSFKGWGLGPAHVEMVLQCLKHFMAAQQERHRRLAAAEEDNGEGDPLVTRRRREQSQSQGQHQSQDQQPSAELDPLSIDLRGNRLSIAEFTHLCHLVDGSRPTLEHVLVDASLHYDSGILRTIIADNMIAAAAKRIGVVAGGSSDQHNNINNNINNNTNSRGPQESSEQWTPRGQRGADATHDSGGGGYNSVGHDHLSLTTGSAVGSLLAGSAGGGGGERRSPTASASQHQRKPHSIIPAAQNDFDSGFTVDITRPSASAMVHAPRYLAALRRAVCEACSPSCPLSALFFQFIVFDMMAHAADPAAAISPSSRATAAGARRQQQAATMMRSFLGSQTESITLMNTSLSISGGTAAAPGSGGGGGGFGFAAGGGGRVLGDEARAGSVFCRFSFWRAQRKADEQPQLLHRNVDARTLQRIGDAAALGTADRCVACGRPEQAHIALPVSSSSPQAPAPHRARPLEDSLQQLMLAVLDAALGPYRHLVVSTPTWLHRLAVSLLELCQLSPTAAQAHQPLSPQQTATVPDVYGFPVCGAMDELLTPPRVYSAACCHDLAVAVLCNAAGLEVGVLPDEGAATSSGATPTTCAAPAACRHAAPSVPLPSAQDYLSLVVPSTTLSQPVHRTLTPGKALCHSSELAAPHRWSLHPPLSGHANHGLWGGNDDPQGNLQSQSTAGAGAGSGAMASYNSSTTYYAPPQIILMDGSRNNADFSTPRQQRSPLISIADYSAAVGGSNHNVSSAQEIMSARGGLSVGASSAMGASTTTTSMPKFLATATPRLGMGAQGGGGGGASGGSSGSTGLVEDARNYSTTGSMLHSHAFTTPPHPSQSLGGDSASCAVSSAPSPPRYPLHAGYGSSAWMPNHDPTPMVHDPTARNIAAVLGLRFTNTAVTSAIAACLALRSGGGPLNVPALATITQPNSSHHPIAASPHESPLVDLRGLSLRGALHNITRRSTALLGRGTVVCDFAPPDQPLPAGTDAFDLVTQYLVHARPQAPVGGSPVLIGVALPPRFYARNSSTASASAGRHPLASVDDGQFGSAEASEGHLSVASAALQATARAQHSPAQPLLLSRADGQLFSRPSANSPPAAALLSSQDASLPTFSRLQAAAAQRTGERDPDAPPSLMGSAVVTATHTPTASVHRPFVTSMVETEAPREIVGPRDGGLPLSEDGDLLDVPQGMELEPFVWVGDAVTGGVGSDGGISGSGATVRTCVLIDAVCVHEGMTVLRAADPRGRVLYLGRAATNHFASTFGAFAFASAPSLALFRGLADATAKRARYIAATLPIHMRSKEEGATAEEGISGGRGQQTAADDDRDDTVGTVDALTGIFSEEAELLLAALVSDHQPLWYPNNTNHHHGTSHVRPPSHHYRLTAASTNPYSSKTQHCSTFPSAASSPRTAGSPKFASGSSLGGPPVVSSATFNPFRSSTNPLESSGHHPTDGGGGGGTGAPERDAVVFLDDDSHHHFSNNNSFSGGAASLSFGERSSRKQPRVPPHGASGGHPNVLMTTNTGETASASAAEFVGGFTVEREDEDGWEGAPPVAERPGVVLSDTALLRVRRCLAANDLYLRAAEIAAHNHSHNTNSNSKTPATFSGKGNTQIASPQRGPGLLSPAQCARLRRWVVYSESPAAAATIAADVAALAEAAGCPMGVGGIAACRTERSVARTVVSKTLLPPPSPASSPDASISSGPAALVTTVEVPLWAAEALDALAEVLDETPGIVGEVAMPPRVLRLVDDVQRRLHSRNTETNTVATATSDASAVCVASMLNITFASLLKALCLYRGGRVPDQVRWWQGQVYAVRRGIVLACRRLHGSLAPLRRQSLHWTLATAADPRGEEEGNTSAVEDPTPPDQRFVPALGATTVMTNATVEGGPKLDAVCLLLDDDEDAETLTTLFNVCCANIRRQQRALRTDTNAPNSLSRVPSIRNKRVPKRFVGIGASDEDSDGDGTSGGEHDAALDRQHHRHAPDERDTAAMMDLPPYLQHMCRSRRQSAGAGASGAGPPRPVFVFCERWEAPRWTPFGQQPFILLDAGFPVAMASVEVKMLVEEPSSHGGGGMGFGGDRDLGGTSFAGSVNMGSPLVSASRLGQFAQAPASLSPPEKSPSRSSFSQRPPSQGYHHPPHQPQVPRQRTFRVSFSDDGQVFTTLPGLAIARPVLPSVDGSGVGVDVLSGASPPTADLLPGLGRWAVAVAVLDFGLVGPHRYWRLLDCTSEGGASMMAASGNTVGDGGGAGLDGTSGGADGSKHWPTGLGRERRLSASASHLSPAVTSNSVQSRPLMLPRSRFGSSGPGGALGGPLGAMTGGQRGVTDDATSTVTQATFGVYTTRPYGQSVGAHATSDGALHPILHIPALYVTAVQWHVHGPSQAFAREPLRPLPLALPPSERLAGALKGSGGGRGHAATAVRHHDAGSTGHDEEPGRLCITEPAACGATGSTSFCFPLAGQSNGHAYVLFCSLRGRRLLGRVTDPTQPTFADVSAHPQADADAERALAAARPYVDLLSPVGGFLASVASHDDAAAQLLPHAALALPAQDTVYLFAHSLSGVQPRQWVCAVDRRTGRLREPYAPVSEHVTFSGLAGTFRAHLTGAWGLDADHALVFSGLYFSIFSFSCRQCVFPAQPWRGQLCGRLLSEIGDSGLRTAKAPPTTSAMVSTAPQPNNHTTRVPTAHFPFQTVDIVTADPATASEPVPSTIPSSAGGGGGGGSVLLIASGSSCLRWWLPPVRDVEHYYKARLPAGDVIAALLGTGPPVPLSDNGPTTTAESTAGGNNRKGTKSTALVIHRLDRACPAAYHARPLGTLSALPNTTLKDFMLRFRSSGTGPRLTSLTSAAVSFYIFDRHRCAPQDLPQIVTASVGAFATLGGPCVKRLGQLSGVFDTAVVPVHVTPTLMRAALTAHADAVDVGGLSSTDSDDDCEDGEQYDGFGGAQTETKRVSVNVGGGGGAAAGADTTGGGAPPPKPAPLLSRASLAGVGNMDTKGKKEASAAQQALQKRARRLRRRTLEAQLLQAASSGGGDQPSQSATQDSAEGGDDAAADGFIPPSIQGLCDVYFTTAAAVQLRGLVLVGAPVGVTWLLQCLPNHRDRLEHALRRDSNPTNDPASSFGGDDDVDPSSAGRRGNGELFGVGLASSADAPQKEGIIGRTVESADEAAQRAEARIFHAATHCHEPWAQLATIQHTDVVSVTQLDPFAAAQSSVAALFRLRAVAVAPHNVMLHRLFVLAAPVEADTSSNNKNTAPHTAQSPAAVTVVVEEGGAHPRMTASLPQALQALPRLPSLAPFTIASRIAPLPTPLIPPKAAAADVMPNQPPQALQFTVDVTNAAGPSGQLGTVSGGGAVSGTVVAATTAAAGASPTKSIQRVASTTMLSLGNTTSSFSGFSTGGGGGPPPLNFESSTGVFSSMHPTTGGDNDGSGSGGGVPAAGDAAAAVEMATVGNVLAQATLPLVAGIELRFSRGTKGAFAQLLQHSAGKVVASLQQQQGSNPTATTNADDAFLSASQRFRSGGAADPAAMVAPTPPQEQAPKLVISVRATTAPTVGGGAASYANPGMGTGSPAAAGSMRHLLQQVAAQRANLGPAPAPSLAPPADRLEFSVIDTLTIDLRAAAEHGNGVSWPVLFPVPVVASRLQVWLSLAPVDIDHTTNHDQHASHERGPLLWLQDVVESVRWIPVPTHVTCLRSLEGHHRALSPPGGASEEGPVLGSPGQQALAGAAESSSFFPAAGSTLRSNPSSNSTASSGAHGGLLKTTTTPPTAPMGLPLPATARHEPSPAVLSASHAVVERQRVVFPARIATTLSQTQSHLPPPLPASTSLPTTVRFEQWIDVNDFSTAGIDRWQALGVSLCRVTAVIAARWSRGGTRAAAAAPPEAPQAATVVGFDMRLLAVASVASHEDLAGQRPLPPPPVLLATATHYGSIGRLFADGIFCDLLFSPSSAIGAFVKLDNSNNNADDEHHATMTSAGFRLQLCITPHAASLATLHQCMEQQQQQQQQPVVAGGGGGAQPLPSTEVFSLNNDTAFFGGVVTSPLHDDMCSSSVCPYLFWARGVNLYQFKGPIGTVVGGSHAAANATLGRPASATQAHRHSAHRRPSSAPALPSSRRITNQMTTTTTMAPPLPFPLSSLARLRQLCGCILAHGDLHGLPAPTPLPGPGPHAIVVWNGAFGVTASLATHVTVTLHNPTHDDQGITVVCGSGGAGRNMAAPATVTYIRSGSMGTCTIPLSCASTPQADDGNAMSASRIVLYVHGQDLDVMDVRCSRQSSGGSIGSSSGLEMVEANAADPATTATTHRAALLPAWALHACCTATLAYGGRVILLLPTGPGADASSSSSFPVMFPVRRGTALVFRGRTDALPFAGIVVRVPARDANGTPLCLDGDVIELSVEASAGGSDTYEMVGVMRLPQQQSLSWVGTGLGSGRTPTRWRLTCLQHNLSRDTAAAVSGVAAAAVSSSGTSKGLSPSRKGSNVFGDAASLLAVEECQRVLPLDVAFAMVPPDPPAVPFIFTPANATLNTNVVPRNLPGPSKRQLMTAILNDPNSTGGRALQHHHHAAAATAGSAGGAPHQRGSGFHVGGGGPLPAYVQFLGQRPDIGASESIHGGGSMRRTLRSGATGGGGGVSAAAILAVGQQSQQPSNDIEARQTTSVAATASSLQHLAINTHTPQPFVRVQFFSLTDAMHEFYVQYSDDGNTYTTAAIHAQRQGWCTTTWPYQGHHLHWRVAVPVLASAVSFKKARRSVASSASFVGDADDAILGAVLEPVSAATFTSLLWFIAVPPAIAAHRVASASEVRRWSLLEVNPRRWDEIPHSDPARQCAYPVGFGVPKRHASLFGVFLPWRIPHSTAMAVAAARSASSGKPLGSSFKASPDDERKLAAAILRQVNGKVPTTALRAATAAEERFDQALPTVNDPCIALEKLEADRVRGGLLQGKPMALFDCTTRAGLNADNGIPYVSLVGKTGPAGVFGITSLAGRPASFRTQFNTSAMTHAAPRVCAQTIATVHFTHDESPSSAASHISDTLERLFPPHESVAAEALKTYFNWAVSVPAKRSQVGRGGYAKQREAFARALQRRSAVIATANYSAIVGGRRESLPLSADRDLYAAYETPLHENDMAIVFEVSTYADLLRLFRCPVPAHHAHVEREHLLNALRLAEDAVEAQLRTQQEGRGDVMLGDDLSAMTFSEVVELADTLFGGEADGNSQDNNQNQNPFEDLVGVLEQLSNVQHQHAVSPHVVTVTCTRPAADRGSDSDFPQREVELCIAISVPGVPFHLQPGSEALAMELLPSRVEMKIVVRQGAGTARNATTTMLHIAESATQLWSAARLPILFPHDSFFAHARITHRSERLRHAGQDAPHASDNGGWESKGRRAAALATRQVTLLLTTPATDERPFGDYAPKVSGIEVLAEVALRAGCAPSVCSMALSGRLLGHPVTLEPVTRQALHSTGGILSATHSVPPVITGAEIHLRGRLPSLPLSALLPPALFGSAADLAAILPSDFFMYDAVVESTALPASLPRGHGRSLAHRRADSMRMAGPSLSAAFGSSAQLLASHSVYTAGAGGGGGGAIGGGSSALSTSPSSPMLHAAASAANASGGSGGGAGGGGGMVSSTDAMPLTVRGRCVWHGTEHELRVAVEGSAVRMLVRPLRKGVKATMLVTASKDLAVSGYDCSVCITCTLPVPSAAANALLGQPPEKGVGARGGGGVNATASVLITASSSTASLLLDLTNNTIRASRRVEAVVLAPSEQHSAHNTSASLSHHFPLSVTAQASVGVSAGCQRGVRWAATWSPIPPALVEEAALLHLQPTTATALVDHQFGGAGGNTRNAYGCVSTPSSPREPSPPSAADPTAHVASLSLAPSTPRLSVAEVNIIGYPPEASEITIRGTLEGCAFVEHFPLSACLRDASCEGESADACDEPPSAGIANTLCNHLKARFPFLFCSV